MLPRQLLMRRTIMEQALGRALPFTIIMIVLILAIGFHNVNQDNKNSDVKRDIVQACQTSNDVGACAEQLVETTNKLDD
jgi:hypothetical protein